MNKEQQRIKIAEACPECIEHFEGVWYFWKNGNRYPCLDNDPLSDLNAMHEAEKTLADATKREYIKQLVLVVNESEWSKWPTAHATAEQRAEAFLKTLDL